MLDLRGRLYVRWETLVAPLRLEEEGLMMPVPVHGAFDAPLSMQKVSAMDRKGPSPAGAGACKDEALHSTQA